MQVELGGGSEPMLRATEVELFDGLVARGLPGRGALGARRRRGATTACTRTATCSWSAAGRPGLAAAYAAARDRRAGDPRRVGAGAVAARARRPRAGAARGRSGSAIARRRRRCCCAPPRSAPTTRATSCSPSAAPTTSAGDAAARRRRASGCGTCARGRVVLATGAHERPIAFAGNDLPGVMLAGAAREYLERFGVARRARAVVLHHERRRLRRGRRARGRRRRDRRGRRRAAGRPRGAATAPSTWPARSCRAAEGERRVTAAVVGDRAIACDLLLVSGGWSPAVHLLSQAQGTRALGRGRRRVRPRRVPDGCARRRRGDRHLRPRRVPRAGRRRRRGGRAAPGRRTAPRRAGGGGARRRVLWSVPPPAGRG